MTGFDGRNIGVTFDAIELKCLMAVLQRADTQSVFQAAQFITEEGFLYTPIEITAHIAHSILVTRNMLSQVTNKQEEESMDEPVPDTPATPPLMVM